MNGGTGQRGRRVTGAGARRSGVIRRGHQWAAAVRQRRCWAVSGKGERRATEERGASGRGRRGRRSCASAAVERRQWRRHDRAHSCGGQSRGRTAGVPHRGAVGTRQWGSGWLTGTMRDGEAGRWGSPAGLRGGLRAAPASGRSRRRGHGRRQRGEGRRRGRGHGVRCRGRGPASRLRRRGSARSSSGSRGMGSERGSGVSSPIQIGSGGGEGVAMWGGSGSEWVRVSVATGLWGVGWPAGPARRPAGPKPSEGWGVLLFLSVLSFIFLFIFFSILNRFKLLTHFIKMGLLHHNYLCNI